MRKSLVVQLWVATLFIVACGSSFPQEGRVYLAESLHDFSTIHSAKKSTTTRMGSTEFNEIWCVMLANHEASKMEGLILRRENLLWNDVGANKTVFLKLGCDNWEEQYVPWKASKAGIDTKKVIVGRWTFSKDSKSGALGHEFLSDGTVIEGFFVDSSRDVATGSYVMTSTYTFKDAETLVIHRKERTYYDGTQQTLTEQEQVGIIYHLVINDDASQLFLRKEADGSYDTLPFTLYKYKSTK